MLLSSSAILSSPGICNISVGTAAGENFGVIEPGCCGNIGLKNPLAPPPLVTLCCNFDMYVVVDIGMLGIFVFKCGSSR